MTLPAISIPEIPIPSNITDFLSSYLGDYLIHFIIVIPVIVLFLEIYNLATKHRSISLFSLLMLLVLSLFIVSFYLVGSVSGDEHKLLTIYFVYVSLGLLVFKLFFMALRKTVGRVIFILMLGGFVALTLLEVGTGGLFTQKVDTTVTDESSTKLKELQSKYDTLEEAKKADTKVSDEATAKVKELQSKYDTLEEAKKADAKVSDEVTAKLKELQSKYDALVGEAKKDRGVTTSVVEKPVITKPIIDESVVEESNASL